MIPFVFFLLKLDKGTVPFYFTLTLNFRLNDGWFVPFEALNMPPKEIFKCVTVVSH